MIFESLTIELLLDVFEFIDGVQLLRVFYGLNFRFNNLLLIHYKQYHINFRSISKHNFDIICQQHLLLIFDRIISLHLSNDDEIPNLPNIFLSYGFNLNHFQYIIFVQLIY